MINLNGQKVDRIPEGALKEMSARLTRVVRDYFTQHPEQFDEWMQSMGFSPESEEGFAILESPQQIRNYESNS